MSLFPRPSIKLSVSILLRFLLTTLLIWAMVSYLPEYLVVTGGWRGLITVAALITLMNLVVAPLLNLMVFPLKLFATILAIVVANAVFLWLTVWVVAHMEPSIVTMNIKGGIPGWILMAIILGLGKWLMNVILK